MEMKTYASIKSAKAAAKKEGEINPVIIEADGRFTWAAPAPVVTTKPKTKASAAPRVEQNGVKRPKPGGLCAAVWEYLDKHGDMVTAKNIRIVADEKGWNRNNASIELYQWRKFNNISRTATST